jgi:phosphonate transport system substrate-binding protein
MLLRLALRSMALLLALLVLAPLGCRREEKRIGQPGAPVVMVLSPAHGADAARVQELEHMLREASGLEVELRVAPSGEAAVRMAGSPNTDAALLTVFEYLFCRQLHGVTAALRVVRKGGATSHHGELVARRDGDVKKVSDLAGKKVAYVDRYSTTGYLLAAKLLADAGIEAKSTFTGTHDSALAELKAGRADAAATYADAVKGDDELTVLAHTQDIPNEPLFFRANLAAEKRKSLTDAFLKIATTDDGRRVLAGMANIEGFATTTDSDYQSTADVFTSIGKSVKDLIPRGWMLSNEQERRPGDLAP